MIEGGEAGVVFDGEGEEVEVGQAFGAFEDGKTTEVGQADLVWPKLMSGCLKDVGEEATGLHRGRETVGVSGPTQNSDEGVFREGAGGPTFDRSGLLKKPEGFRPMGMVGIAEGDQEIGIEEVDHCLPVAIAITRASSSSY